MRVTTTAPSYQSARPGVGKPAGTCYPWEVPQEHPADRLAPSVATLVQRSLYTRLALGFTIAVRAVDAIVRVAFASTDSALVQSAAAKGVAATTTCLAAMYWIAGVAFLSWVHRLVLVTRQLNGRSLPWAPSSVVWGFVVPILNFFRPYQILLDVQQLLVQNEIPEPAPQPLRSGEGGYRAMAFESLPPARAVSNAFLGWWWGLWVVLTLVGNAPERGMEDAAMALRHAAVDGLVVLTGIFALRVVSSLTARIEERFRRIRHTQPEALAQQNVFLG